MNAQLALYDEEFPDPNLEAEEAPEKVKWELKKLKPQHMQVASLIAQGMKNIEVAAICGITPEYVSMLLGQPLVKAYIQDMCEVVGVRMEALFAQSVDVIAETMKSGTEGGKLKAARLQLEATKRIGRVDPNVGGNGSNIERLEQLAERILALQSNVRKGHTFNENGQEIIDA
jgi:Bacterial regulatory proteins, luxR family.